MEDDKTFASTEWLIDKFVPDLEKVEYVRKVLDKRPCDKFRLLAIDLGVLVPASCATADCNLKEMENEKEKHEPAFAKYSFYKKLHEHTNKEIHSRMRNRSATHERSRRSELKSACSKDTQALFRNATTVEDAVNAVKESLMQKSKKRSFTSDTSRKKEKRSQNIQKIFRHFSSHLFLFFYTAPEPPRPQGKIFRIFDFCAFSRQS